MFGDPEPLENATPISEGIASRVAARRELIERRHQAAITHLNEEHNAAMEETTQTFQAAKDSNPPLPLPLPLAFFPMPVHVPSYALRPTPCTLCPMLYAQGVQLCLFLCPNPTLNEYSKTILTQP